ncbi:MAG: hypothetical protein ACREPI_01855 [Candidatus Dormibacterales bacterium]
MTERERRIREVKYARRRKMRYIDKLLEELEMLNLAEERQLPRPLIEAVDRLIVDAKPAAQEVDQRTVTSVPEAMDALYEIQDSLMFNQIEDE